MKCWTSLKTVQKSYLKGSVKMFEYQELNTIESELEGMYNLLDRKLNKIPVKLNEGEVEYLKSKTSWLANIVEDIEKTDDEFGYMMNTVNDGLEVINGYLEGNETMSGMKIMYLSIEIRELLEFIGSEVK